MKKRLRKKLHLKEFVSLSFETAFLPARPLTDAEMEAFNDRLLSWLVPRGQWDAFSFRVGKDGLVRTACCGLFGSRERYGTTTEADRVEMLAWLRAQPEVREAWVGPFVDLYHPGKWLPRVGPDDTELPKV